MKEMMTASLRAPFNLEKVMKIAQVRFECTCCNVAYYTRLISVAGYIDDINRIHNPELCAEELSFLLEAYISANEDRKHADPMKNPEWIAQHFATMWAQLIQSFYGLNNTCVAVFTTRICSQQPGRLSLTTSGQWRQRVCTTRTSAINYAQATRSAGTSC
jgi:hypothetical protein